MADKLKFSRLPQNEDELWWTVNALWGVTIPRHTCGDPTHTAPFELFADAYFNRDGTIAFWHGSRGLSGKSFMLSILGLTKAFLLGTDVNILGGSINQSTNVHEAMRTALDSENAPRDMLVAEGSHLIKLSNKARIRPLTASQKTVRGPHPPFLLLDEIDEMDQNILDAALGQPMPQKNYLGVINRPYTVMCSTWQNPEGTFTAMKRRWEERGQPMKTWCYRCTSNPIDGWLDQETIDAKKLEISAEMWRVEYELGEPSIGNRAFDSDSVEKMFSLPFEPIKEKTAKDFEEYTFEDPKADGTYVVAADWAKQHDYTVISVWRTDKAHYAPINLVYYARLNRRPYPFMIDMFNKATRIYQAEPIHDGTGLGQVVSDLVDLRARSFQMIGAKRSNMLSEYVAAVENGRLIAPRIPSAYQAHKYAQVGDLYQSGQQFHLPDEVCSFGLAFKHARSHTVGGVPLTLKPDGTPSVYAAALDPPKDEERVQGQIYKESGNDSGFSFIV